VPYIVAMTGPMTGVKVVEMGVWIAGPATGAFMADWGADVVKIEPPGRGDPSRMFQMILGNVLPSNPIFEMDNRSKRSIALDVNTRDGKAVAMELLGHADVFITNLRTSALENMGLDWASLEEVFPRLIYCHVTGYGTEGPDVNRPAFDVAAFWSRAGIAALLSDEGADPPFQRGGMGDHNAGMAGAAAISAALFEREKSGLGQRVSTSLFREGMYTIAFDLNTMLMWGQPIAKGKRTTMGNPAMNNYQAGDGKRFWITGLEGARHWPPLARVCGHPEWMEDERFNSQAGRAQNAEALIALIDEVFLTKPMAEWVDIFATEPDFFWAPINSMEDLVADEQAWAGGGIIDVPNGAGSAAMVATPVDFSRTQWAARSMAPGLGEHTDEVLAALGRSEADIAALRDAGTIA